MIAARLEIFPAGAKGEVFIYKRTQNFLMEGFDKFGHYRATFEYLYDLPSGKPVYRMTSLECLKREKENAKTN